MSTPQINITDFFSSEFVDYASYDNIRKIGSVIDGFKNSSRKVIHTVLDKNINTEIKVDALASITSGYTLYLHGSMNLNGVIVNLAQDFTGKNNIPLIQAEGNFGNRQIREASAPRYISTLKQRFLNTIINPKDNAVLEEQNFEGELIEPKYFLPIIPLLLINGSDGVSTGFAQSILPRNPLEIKDYLVSKLKDKPFKGKLIPYYKGFRGTTEQLEPGRFVFKGTVEIKRNKVLITELPVGYDLKGYIKILEKLEEEKKIRSYKDLSSDVFQFEVTLDKPISEDEAIRYLKLSTTETENYTSINENNKILQFKTVEEVLEYYFDFRLNKYEERKQTDLSKIQENILRSMSTFLFIENVNNGVIELKAKEEEIINTIKTIDGIVEVEGSYNYLLNMPVRNLTKEKMAELQNKINGLKEEYLNLENMNVKDIWLSEIEDLYKLLKKDGII
jgi:DNA topoisomerase-2